MVSLGDLDFDDVAAWPLRKQIGLVLLLFVAIQLFVSWFSLKPRLSQLYNLKQQETMLTAQLHIKTELDNEAPNINSSVEQLTKEYEGLLVQLPTAKELASLLASINDTGLQNQLTLSQLNWGASQPYISLHRIPLDLELTGSYFDIVNFFERITEMPFHMDLSEVNWQRIHLENQKIRLQLRAYTYLSKREVLNAD